MKKYYYNNFLVRKSDNDYAYAVGCIVGNNLKLFGCHRNLDLATKRFNETKKDLERCYKSWENVPEEDMKYFSVADCERNFKASKYLFDNLMIIKLEVR